MPREIELVLGLMPEGASPETHLAAGPWCFAGQEEKFPDWERKFTFAPEPLARAEMPELAARAAQCLCARSISKLAELISDRHGDFSPVYWQVLLAPWAIAVAGVIIEHAMRCTAMIELWGQTRLALRLMPSEMDFAFVDEHDFSLRGRLGQPFNHWLFSRLLEANFPEKWTKIYCEGAHTVPLGANDRSWRGRLRLAARNMMLDLPFPKMKGMNPRQALLYSSALFHPCRQKDHSLNWDEAFNHQDALQKIHLPEDVFPLFLAALPASIRNLRHRRTRQRSVAPRLRVASIIAYEDAAYRQKLARWREKGNRLAYAQHGGNYGQIKVACDTEMVEYSQDIFFTWGWKRHGACKGNFVPLPSPQLAAIADKWRGEVSGGLVFTGTEMAAFGYRLDSRPTPLQFLAYRRAKAVFFETLGPELQAQSHYRPYFSLPGTFEDANWLLPRFPLLKLCTGPLLQKMLGCNLLVLDHPGTTLLEAMAANIPVILYWNRAHWPLTRQCDHLLDKLEKCGIWHETPQMAAQKALDVWSDAKAWWNSGEIQVARMAFCREQASLPAGNLNAIWMKNLKEM